jgi:hypothetical protein
VLNKHIPGQDYLWTIQNIDGRYPNCDIFVLVAGFYKGKTKELIDIGWPHVSIQQYERSEFHSAHIKFAENVLVSGEWFKYFLPKFSKLNEFKESNDGRVECELRLHWHNFDSTQMLGIHPDLQKTLGNWNWYSSIICKETQQVDAGKRTQ